MIPFLLDTFRLVKGVSDILESSESDVSDKFRYSEFWKITEWFGILQSIESEVSDQSESVVSWKISSSPDAMAE